MGDLHAVEAASSSLSCSFLLLVLIRSLLWTHRVTLLPRFLRTRDDSDPPCRKLWWTSPPPCGSSEGPLGTPPWSDAMAQLDNMAKTSPEVILRSRPKRPSSGGSGRFRPRFLAFLEFAQKIVRFLSSITFGLQTNYPNLHHFSVEGFETDLPSTNIGAFFITSKKN